MIRPFWKLLHVVARPDGLLDGERAITLCGKRRPIHIGPDIPPLPLMACTECTFKLIDQAGASVVAVNDALERLVDISAVMNRPGAARGDGAA